MAAKYSQHVGPLDNASSPKTSDRGVNMEELRDNIKNKDKEKAMEDLNKLDSNRNALNYDFGHGETILHVATKYDDGDLVKAILERKPELVLKKKTGIYEGQTPLHIAITKANRRAMKLMLDCAKQQSRDDLSILLRTCATGSQFEGTVMMGQLPLFVAALKFDRKMIIRLLSDGADLHAKDKNGNTIFHVLINYLHRKRDKDLEVKQMLDFFHQRLVSMTEKMKAEKDEDELEEYLNEKEQRSSAKQRIDDGEDEENDEYNADEKKITSEYPNYTHLWLTRNKEGLTPLKLAAKHKLMSVFEFILELKDVYCFPNEDEGLFDIKKYDVTEIDSIANITEEKKRGKGINESVLEMMFDSKFSRKFYSAIIELAPIKKLIQKKWKYYARIYVAWMVVQFLFMMCLTAYAVDRSTWHRNNASDIGTDIAAYFESNNIGRYVIVFQWISFVFALGYLFLVVILVKNAYKRPNARLYWTHNIEFIVLMFVLSIALIIDLIVTVSRGRHDSVALILALFSGWWFNVFFLRGWHLFSFFTVMIKDVLLGDFPRFSIIIAFQLFAFTTSMHTVFQGENVPTIDGSEYNNFGRTLLTMFNLMLGLGEIEVLNKARVPWLAITLFVLFVLVTYVLLLNALIAMMSSTCENVLEDKYSVWRIQQLSVILFLESIICDPLLRVLTRDPNKKERKVIYDFDSKQDKTQCRHFLNMKSKKKIFVSQEDTDTLKKRTQEDVDRTVKHIITSGIEEDISEYPDDNDMDSELLTLLDHQTPSDALSSSVRYPQFEEIAPKPALDLSRTIHRNLGDQVVIFEDGKYKYH